ncbi:hypothetical protein [Cohnella massiliensis]|uniref:hypothetical protein n=1 Tax=Cohnella massiliensis TaxID=1816691 RepID=UPI0009BA0184|nr:hypothetical protein [Cohnella massiliensis]
MNLEELIYQKLQQDATLSDQLSVFAELPAIFWGQAPEDTDEGWANAQYPRVDYVADRSWDPERKVEGALILNVWCLVSSAVVPEVIEDRLRSLLDGAVFHPADEPVTALRWNRSDPFEASNRGDGDELIVGVTVSFDLLAFPAQTTYSPDPIASLNAWAGDKYAELQVDPASWSPSDSTPALYWRLSGVTAVERTNWGIWVTVSVAGHILAPSPATRLNWIRQLVEAAARAKRIRMDDGSPMFVTRVSADSSQDSFREGQVRLSARFGVLNEAIIAEKLGQLTINSDHGGGVVK